MIPLFLVVVGVRGGSVGDRADADCQKGEEGVISCKHPGRSRTEWGWAQGWAPALTKLSELEVLAVCVVASSSQPLTWGCQRRASCGEFCENSAEICKSIALQRQERVRKFCRKFEAKFQQ